MGPTHTQTHTHTHTHTHTQEGGAGRRATYTQTHTHMIYTNRQNILIAHTCPIMKFAYVCMNVHTYIRAQKRDYASLSNKTKEQPKETLIQPYIMLIRLT